MLYIVAIGWIYVTLMMSITERTVVAGVMTFLLYGVVPLMIILYLMGTPQRRRRRRDAENAQQEIGVQADAGKPAESVTPWEQKQEP